MNKCTEKDDIPSHNSQRWDIVLLGAFIHNSSVSFTLAYTNVAIEKVVSWALCSREQYTLRVGLTNHVSVACFNRTLQFLVSPHIGSLSDKYGRKKILLISMIGNILSALV